MMARSLAARLALALGAALALAGPLHAQRDEPAQDRARTQISPYVEANAVVSAALDGDSDVLTYVSAAAGIDASVQTRRIRAQANYRYERRFEVGGNLGDDDVHSGLAAAQFDLTRNLTVEAGALASRARTSLPGPIPGFDAVDDDLLSQVFAAFAGPTVSANAGPVAVNASYRLSYVTVGNDNVLTFPGGRRRIDYDDSVQHQLTASAGMAPGRLPFGWTVGGGYVREDADALDQRYEGAFVRGDVVVPVSPTLALTAGVGYETIQQSQRDYVRGPNGLPIVDRDGDLVTDRSSPRRRATDIDGFIYDAGILWRPTRRTELQLRAGHRYEGLSVTGSLSHQFNENSGLNAAVYDSISSFGRLLVTDLAGVPTNFVLPRGQFVGGGGGCVFGGDPGSGVCFDDALQAVTSANFRNRGATLTYSRSRGPWSLGLGANYAHREYLAPDGSGPFLFEDVTDQSFSLQGDLGRRLTRNSGISFNASAQWFGSSLDEDRDIFGLGATGTYYRSVTEQLQGTASLGLFHTSADEIDSSYLALLVGLRYGF